MKPTNSTGLLYTPGSPPNSDDAAEMRRFLLDELQKIAAVIRAVSEGQLDTSYSAPAKPRQGMVRLADGTKWNPGSGAGVYAYYGSAWHLLG